MQLTFNKAVKVLASMAQDLAGKDEKENADPTNFIGAAIQESRFLNNAVTCCTIIAESPCRDAINNVSGKDSTGQIPKERQLETAERALSSIAFWAILGPVTEYLNLMKYGGDE